MSAGLLFGPLIGTIIVSISGTVAASIAFLIARYFAHERILKLVEGNKKFLAIDKAIGENGFRVVTLLRLSPSLPLSLGNYLYGLTSVFVPYVMGSWLGMLPGTWAYVSAGAFGRTIIASLLFPSNFFVQSCSTLILVNFYLWIVTGNMGGADKGSDSTNALNGNSSKNTLENAEKVENLIREVYEGVTVMFRKTDRRFDDLAKDLLDLTMRSYEHCKLLRETTEVLEAEVTELRGTLSDEVADLSKQVRCVNNAIKNLKTDLLDAVKTEVQKFIETKKEPQYVDLTLESDGGNSKPLRRARASARSVGGKLKVPAFSDITKPKKKTTKCRAGPFTVGIHVSPEDSMLVDYVFRTGNEGGIAMIIITFLTREDILSLAPKSPLSTLILYTVVEKLTWEDRDKTKRECAFLSVTFAAKASGNRDDLLSFISLEHVKTLYCTDIRDCEAIFIPIYMGNHFLLCVVNLKMQQYCIWDSLPSCIKKTEINQKLVDILAALDLLFVDDGAGWFLGVSSFLAFEFNPTNNAPRQPNTWDCGMFVINWMKCGRSLNKKTAKCMGKRFNSEDERLKLVLELIDCTPNEKTALLDKARELVP
ncbi:unnamed protein product [Linum trigynum]|uniref:Ubiquitin-like protease family profile domain-containing protein n=1 Tax=Linum trigynum TaxID=586398 RepID=A0AAV2F882_9ROSI